MGSIIDHIGDTPQDVTTTEGGVWSDTRHIMITDIPSAISTHAKGIYALLHQAVPVDGAPHPAGYGMVVLRRSATLRDNTTAIVRVEYGIPSNVGFDPSDPATQLSVGATSQSVQSDLDGSGNAIKTKHDGSTEKVATIESRESLASVTYRRLRAENPLSDSLDYVNTVNSEASLFGYDDVKGCFLCDAINGDYVPDSEQWLVTYRFTYRPRYLAQTTAAGGAGGKSTLEGWQVRVIETRDGEPIPVNEWNSETVKIVSPFKYAAFAGLGI